MVEVYSINIQTPISNAEYSNCLRIVSEEKRIQIDRFLSSQDAKRSLFGELLIRYLVSTKLDIRNSNIFIEKDKFGKPFLKINKSFYFNISHSGDWVVCAISEKMIGIDVEQIQTIDLTIAKQCFSQKEYNDIEEKTSEERLEAFYTYWTLKESYIKLLGKGFFLPLNSFKFIKESDSYVLDEDNNGFKFFSTRYKNEYMLAIACKDNIKSLKIQELKVSELLLEKRLKG